MKSRIFFTLSFAILALGMQLGVNAAHKAPSGKMMCNAANCQCVWDTTEKSCNAKNSLICHSNGKQSNCNSYCASLSNEFQCEATAGELKEHRGRRR